MSSRNTIARSLHDLGAASWFGGSLMAAVGVNGAAGDLRVLAGLGNTLARKVRD